MIPNLVLPSPHLVLRFGTEPDLAADDRKQVARNKRFILDALAQNAIRAISKKMLEDPDNVSLNYPEIDIALLVVRPSLHRASLPSRYTISLSPMSGRSKARHQ